MKKKMNVKQTEWEKSSHHEKETMNSERRGRNGEVERFEKKAFKL